MIKSFLIVAKTNNFLRGKLEENDPQELKQEFMAGNYNKTVLAGVSIVKGEFDTDGRHVLQDGRQTVEALKELFLDFNTLCSNLKDGDDGKVDMPDSLVNVFVTGIHVDVFRYGDGYDRLVHIAFETSRHEIESNRFEPHKPVAWRVFGVLYRYIFFLHLPRVKVGLCITFGLFFFDISKSQSWLVTNCALKSSVLHFSSFLQVSKLSCAKLRFRRSAWCCSSKAVLLEEIGQQLPRECRPAWYCSVVVSKMWILPKFGFELIPCVNLMA